MRIVFGMISVLCWRYLSLYKPLQFNFIKLQSTAALPFIFKTSDGFFNVLAYSYKPGNLPDGKRSFIWKASNFSVGFLYSAPSV